VIRELIESRAGEEYELYARTINPQFMRVLKTIGFDRVWRAPRGSTCTTTTATATSTARRLRDVQRRAQQPAVRAALVESARARDARARVSSACRCSRAARGGAARRTPAALERVLFTSSGTEAVEAALKLGRAATGRAARRLDASTASTV
jgi:ornithine--oxo-acid transaminase